MDDSIASARREEAIERAEVQAFNAMKRPTAIFDELKAAIDKHKDEMTALADDATYAERMMESLKDWHKVAEQSVRKENFTGSLEWMA